MVKDELEVRRKRALFRATHRGTMEMDWLLGRYAVDRLEHMDAQALLEFEVFIDLPDPDLQHMIMNGHAVADPDCETLVKRLREFHGLPTQDNTPVPNK